MGDAICASPQQNASKTEPSFWEVFWGLNVRFAVMKRKVFQKSGKTRGSAGMILF